MARFCSRPILPVKAFSRFDVFGQQIVPDLAVAASFDGNPTDIAYQDGLAAVIDANGTVSHLSIFRVDDGGNLSLRAQATIDSIATNSVALVSIR